MTLENNDSLQNRTEGILISKEYMSSGLFNCLRRAGYKYLSEIIDLELESLSNIKNLGAQKLEELDKIRTSIAPMSRSEIEKFCSNDDPDTTLKTKDYIDDVEVLTYIKRTIPENKIVYFMNPNGDAAEDFEIPFNEVSLRTYNGLRRIGIKTIRQLAFTKIGDLRKQNGLGKKSLEEIYNYIDERTQIKVLENSLDDNSREIDREFNSIVEYFRPCIWGQMDSIQMFELKKEISELLLVNGKVRQIERDDLIYIVNSPVLKSIIKKSIYEKASSSFLDEITLSVYQDEFARLIRLDENILEVFLEELVNEKRIIEYKGSYFKYHITLKEWIETLTDNARIAVSMRCNGGTLEEIGGQLHVTRERARQILSKTFRLKPVLFEDGYREIYEKYGFRNKEFSDLLDVNDVTINYLDLLYKKGFGTIYDLIEDKEIPKSYKRRISKAFKDAFLVVDDNTVIPLRREDLIEWYIKKYFSDTDCTMAELETFYYDFLKSFELESNEKLCFPTSHALEARLVDSSFCLLKYGKRIRYYNTESFDIHALCEQINISQYLDTEISTLKLFIDNSELMEELDIRDEYELHNLLRKNQQNLHYYNITIERMPFISIGNADREKQVKELLFQMAPISNEELAIEYELRYGVKKETVLANFFKCIDEYLNNGIFNVKQKRMQLNDFNALRMALTDDFYLLEEVERIYSNITKYGNFDELNSMNIKNLGFRIYSQYIVKNTYQSADAYFNKILTESPDFYIDNLRYGVKRIQSFYSCLYSLRDDLDLIEIEKNHYLSFECFRRKYIECDKEDLLIIGKHIIGRRNRNIFTITESQISGEENPYNKYINSIYFLNSILRVQENVKSSIFADVCIITKDGRDPSLIELMVELLAVYGPQNYDNLRNILIEDYGVNVGRHKIVYCLKESAKVIVDEAAGYAKINTKEVVQEEIPFWKNSAYEKMVCEKMNVINMSKDLISQIYASEKYDIFRSYCEQYKYLHMKDFISIDLERFCFRNGISKTLVYDIVQQYIVWIKELNTHTKESEDIIDMFFK